MTGGSEQATGSYLSFFQKMLDRARCVVIEGVNYWLVEGDTLLNEEQLRSYAEQQEQKEQARIEKAKAAQDGDLPLVGITVPGPEVEPIYQRNQVVRWAPEVVLSYRVLRESFTVGGDAAYELVVECMQQAARDWENTCGVRFRYLPEPDASSSSQLEDALFTVRELDTGGALIASAFFPNDPPSRRFVLIDPSFYSLDLRFSKVGVLRHELGHVIGFRHEHIRSEAPPGCPGEDLYGTIDLTGYDPQSVMHYFCGEVGSGELAITDVDRAGAQKIYGPPLSTFFFVRG